MNFSLSPNAGVQYRHAQIVFSREATELIRYSVFQLGTGPFILSVEKSGKHLLITGEVPA